LVQVEYEGVTEIREFSRTRKGKSYSVQVAYETVRKERGYSIQVAHEGVTEIGEFSRMKKGRSCSFQVD